MGLKISEGVSAAYKELSDRELQEQILKALRRQNKLLKRLIFHENGALMVKIKQ